MKAEYLDHMGDDLAVVNAARVSFAKWQKEFTGKDKGLLRYLAENAHWTPFAHTAIKLRMQAPVPIRTQCFKHKVGFVENEESRRYISSTPSLYIPEAFRMAPEGSIKQGSGEVHPRSKDLLDLYYEGAEGLIELYEKFIKAGVCPEQARFLLPQGVEVNWIWTGNLLSFSRFCRQRMDSHAQKEIQELAKEVSEIIQPIFPASWEFLMQ